MSEYFITKELPTSYTRIGVDGVAKLKVLVTGDYPIVCSDIAGKFVRGQSFELPIVKTTTSFTAIGGNSSFRTFRTVGDCCDECDINGDVTTGGSTELSLDNSGALHFGAKSYANKTPTTTLSTANVEISFMFRVVGFDWKANTGQTYITNFLHFGGNGGYNGFWLGYYGGYMSLMCSSGGSRGTVCSADTSKYFPLLKDNINDICVVFKTDTDSNVSGTIYFNGQAIATTSYERVFEVFQDAFRLNAPDATKAFTYKDVCVFNFDVSATNAPYKLSDYQQGKPIPFECLDTSAEQRALLALENYTLNGKPLDYSGNHASNKMEIKGSVKGDNDAHIQAFANAITTTTSEQN